MSPAPRADGPPAPAAPRRRIRAQAAFETRMILRNGEQLLITVVVPVLLLIGLSATDVIDLGTAGHRRVDAAVPGVLALAVMSTSFVSQAIATAFDRRNGVLRLMATTPLGRGGLLAGKAIGVLAVEAVQLTVLGATALALGWSPSAASLLLAALCVVLGTAAFTALALLLAGALRAEGVLAVANLVLVLLTVGGGVLVPASELPGGLSHVALLLPSGALGEGLRGALLDGTVPAWSLVVLLGWSAALGWSVRRLFAWH